LRKGILILILIQLLSCEKEKNDIVLQREVFSEIFMELIDSTYIEPRYWPRPSIPVPEIYLDTNIKEKDSIYEKASAHYYEMKK